MPPRHRAFVLVALGVVIGLLAAGLVAWLAWPEDDPLDDVAGADEAAGSSASTTTSETATTVGAAQDDPPAGPAPAVPARPAVDLPELDLSSGNRRAPIPGLPDWSHAGYRGGMDLPADAEVTADESCRITVDELATEYGVRADDGADDTAGLQAAIDTVRAECTPAASYEALSLISLPAGVLDVSSEISVDADYLVLRGAGDDPATGTRLVYRPGEDTRYDTLTDDGGDWDEDGMEFEDGKGGWLWPGRGLLRVQSRAVHEDFQEAYESAPANRKDIFEGTVNVHWKAGVELRSAPGDDGFAARAGDTVVHLADDAEIDRFAVGGFVNVRAANTVAFYEEQAALPTDHELQNLHMRQQIFTVTEVDEDDRTITVDKPLEFDVPVDSTSDGSEPIDGDTYPSKASPLVDPVVGVGLDGFTITQAVVDVDPAAAAHDYANLAPAEEMHGVVFKWAADSWVRGVTTFMTGSHPIVTEEAKNLEIVGNYFDGAWNKGEGGNGYVRGSRVWDSLYAGNIVRNLRHVTFQWSASGNVFIGNDIDADVNLHGGWERNNLFELNVVRVPYEHRPGNCSAHCGGEGGGDEEDESSWYPIWWGAGQKAVKWSGATGPQNVYFNNTMAKQLSEGGEFAPYYTDPATVFQFGWDGSAYEHLSVGGAPIADWAGEEETDFTGGGVDASLTDPGPSLFLANA